MASCSELEDEEGEEDAQEDLQKASSSNIDNRGPPILEALPEHMG